MIILSFSLRGISFHTVDTYEQKLHGPLVAEFYYSIADVTGLISVTTCTVQQQSYLLVKKRSQVHITAAMSINYVVI